MDNFCPLSRNAGFLMVIFLVSVFAIAGMNEIQAQRIPQEADLEPPLADLYPLEGEVVWLQGAIKRGNPAPYRNPDSPLAAYEQGILDETGQLWVVLDTPKGREIRYNPDLRGKMVKLLGWIYPDSRIFEVKEWQMGKHKVRIQEGYEAPPRVPFNPEQAETIESIPPVSLKPIDESLLNQDLWMQGEGLDIHSRNGKQPQDVGVSSESESIQKLLDDLNKGLNRVPQPATASGGLKSATGQILPVPADKAHLFPQAVPQPTPGRTLAPPLTNEQGQPLTRPEEFDAILQKELIQQIVPQK